MFICIHAVRKPEIKSRLHCVDVNNDESTKIIADLLFFHFKSGISDHYGYPLNLYMSYNEKDIVVFLS